MPHLFEIPEGSKIHVIASVHGSKEAPKPHLATFHHLDGMYSFCTIDDMEEDNVFHLSGRTPLKKRTDGTYDIVGD